MNVTAENPYYVWIDQHDILGVGPDTPLATGNQSDSLHALVNGRVIELRVPYPMGFFAKQIDGRIDDPDAGWKGRGLWVTSGNRTPVHIEGLNSPTPGAPGTTLATQSSPLVVHFQLRPDPLIEEVSPHDKREAYGAASSHGGDVSARLLALRWSVPRESSPSWTG